MVQDLTGAWKAVNLSKVLSVIEFQTNLENSLNLEYFNKAAILCSVVRSDAAFNNYFCLF